MTCRDNNHSGELMILSIIALLTIRTSVLVLSMILVFPSHFPSIITLRRFCTIVELLSNSY